MATVGGVLQSWSTATDDDRLKRRKTMRKYDFVTVESDFITHKKHLFYLCGTVKSENCGYVIASYSVKTDRMILKDCSNFMPDSGVLKQFVEIAKERYGENKQ